MTESPVILILILGTVFLSWRAFHDPGMEERWLFRPESVLAGKEYYRLVTAAFVHGGWGHLLFNMYTLSAFGGVVVWACGNVRFLIIYLGSVLGGNLLSLYIHRQHDYASYGASGGVCGVILAYILRFPYSRMSIFPLPYAMPAWLYAGVFILVSFHALKSQRDNIAHDAHLGGSLTGLLLAAILDPLSLQKHWGVFVVLLGANLLVLCYVWYNPLFLPLTSFLPGRRRAQEGASRAHALAPKPSRPQPARPPVIADWQQRAVVDPDWLMTAIEEQVGALRPSNHGVEGWVDKFGRTYAVVRPVSASFDWQSFQRHLLEYLSRPDVNFVILDTRDLAEDQMSRVRPFVADLPDPQFQRVLRSYAFSPARR